MVFLKRIVSHKYFENVTIMELEKSEYYNFKIKKKNYFFFNLGI